MKAAIFLAVLLLAEAASAGGPAQVDLGGRQANQ